MKKLFSTLLLVPSLAMAHLDAAHSHPNELTGGLILLIAVAGAYFLSKKNQD